MASITKRESKKAVKEFDKELKLTGTRSEFHTLRYLSRIPDYYRELDGENVLVCLLDGSCVTGNGYFDDSSGLLNIVNKKNGTYRADFGYLRYMRIAECNTQNRNTTSHDTEKDMGGTNSKPEPTKSETSEKNSAVNVPLGQKNSHDKLLDWRPRAEDIDKPVPREVVDARLSLLSPEDRDVVNRAVYTGKAPPRFLYFYCGGVDPLKSTRDTSPLKREQSMMSYMCANLTLDPGQAMRILKSSAQYEDDGKPYMSVINEAIKFGLKHGRDPVTGQYEQRYVPELGRKIDVVRYSSDEPSHSCETTRQRNYAEREL